MNLDIFQAISIISGVVTLFALIKIINTPFENIRKNTDDIKELKKDLARRSEIDRAILDSLTSITNHMIDGNGVDGLRKSRDELQHILNIILTK